MKYLIPFLISSLLNNHSFAQTKLFTKTGTISFHSKMAVENIEARNNKVVSVWEPASGKIEFSVLMKGFEFQKALMQEHFNENYVESDKYPKATFKGVIENSAAFSLSADNSYPVKVSGALTIHGVTKQINIPAVIKIKNGVVSSSANFSVLLADYNIKIPGVVADNINKKIEISLQVPAYARM